MFSIKNILLNKDCFKLEIPFLEISENGLTLLSGPSGAGKSLFLKILMGFEKSESKFEWLYKEKDLAQLTPPERHLGVVFQTLELFPHLTARENILFHAKARRLDIKKAEERLIQLAQTAKLTDRLGHLVSVLSGGERQRVAILRAIIGEPRILLLDEPFSSLDESIKTDLRVFLKELIKKEKIPCLLVSHDPKDKDIADSILYLENGKLKN